MKIVSTDTITQIHSNYATWLNDFRYGDEAAFNSLFNELYPALYFYSFKITANEPASRDIAEEAFIKAWERRATIHDVKAYLYRVARNASLDWVKAENRRKMAEDEAAAMIPVCENAGWEALITAEVLRELYAGISKLPLQRQRVFKMLYQEGRSVKEVAKELNLSISAIKDHKRTGLIFLRKILRLFVVLTLIKHIIY